GGDARQWGRWHLERGARQAIKWHATHSNQVDLRYVRYILGLAQDEPFTEEWYRAAFDWDAGRGKILGDVTPQYCAIGPDGVSYVRRLLPDVKIIYLIRDPVGRALSQLKMNVSRHGCGDGSPAAWA